MNAMEIFFRAGGLLHINAILDEGTMLSSGALRSMAIERTAGYGKIVVEDNGIGSGDLLIIANAYGINAACLDAAFTAKSSGATTIAVTSITHANQIPEDHPARHPSKINLYQACDYYIDTKVPVGDAVIEIDRLLFFYSGDRLGAGADHALEFPDVQPTSPIHVAVEEPTTDRKSVV